MKKLVLVALLVGSTSAAFAQPAENPIKDSAAHRAAGEPKDEAGNEAKVAEPADPTTHFNYFNFSYRGKDEFGGTFGDGKETDTTGVTYDEEEAMSPPFIFALVNFAILLFLLARMGMPVARKTFEERHDLIKSALDEAAKLRDQANAKLADYEKRIHGLDAEIKSLVDGIRADADADKARILAQAEAQSQQMKRDAETRIAAEILLARAMLTREVTAAAKAATEILVAQKLTPTDQDKLVASFITDMGATPATASKEPS